MKSRPRSRTLGVRGQGFSGMNPIRRNAPYRAGETALLLVDLQRIWLEPGLDPHHPERDGSHAFYRLSREVVVPNNERLLTAARAAGVEVLHTIIRSLTDGRARPFARSQADADPCPAGRAGGVAAAIPGAER